MFFEEGLRSQIRGWMVFIFGKCILFLNLDSKRNEVFFVVSVDLITSKFPGFDGAHKSDGFLVGFDIISELLAFGLVFLDAYL